MKIELELKSEETSKLLKLKVKMSDIQSPQNVSSEWVSEWTMQWWEREERKENRLRRIRWRTTQITTPTTMGGSKRKKLQ